jgi:threonine/homoserine/homoserine lactone efflux protein
MHTALVLAISIRWAALPPLLLTSLAIMGSPGPATISLTAAGVAFGVRRSARYLAGIIAGTVVVLVLVAAGVTGALLAVPGVRPVFLVTAAAYIVYLAYHIATAPPLQTAGGGGPAPSLGGGLLLGVANPKAWVAIAAVFVSGRIASHTIVDSGVKVAVLALMVVAINATWLIAAAWVAPALRDPVRSRRANIGLAAALVMSTAAAFVR